VLDILKMISNARKVYNSFGKLHNEKGPAVVYDDGTKEWWYDGKRHRLDEPAVIESNGCKEWWFFGLRHREDGPAIIYPDGGEEWWYKNEIHRDNDLPAIVDINYKEWWYRGMRHRISGPAEIFRNERKKYYIRGVEYDEERYYKINNLVRKWCFKLLRKLKHKILSVDFCSDISNTVIKYSYKN